MPGVITSRAVARRASKLSCANPLQTMSRSVTIPISRSFSPIGMAPISCSRINFARSTPLCIVSHGRRPMAWWEFDAGDLEHPGRDREQSTLWRAGVLSESERAEVEAEWRREFDVTRGKSARERREHYEFHDIPDELIERWQGTRKRRR